MKRFSLGFTPQKVQTVFQEGDSRFVLLSLMPGQGLTKHRTKQRLVLTVLTGEIEFTVGDNTDVVLPSEMLTVDPLVEHAVVAKQKSTVLLTLIPQTGSDEKTGAAKARTLTHENAYMHPDMISQIAPELRPLVDDHVRLCELLDAPALDDQAAEMNRLERVLSTVHKELNEHFILEEKYVFPLMARHVGGEDVGPVARLLEEHAHIRQLHQEAAQLFGLAREQADPHAFALLGQKSEELAVSLLNHLGKEDSHLFPMASRLLTDEEKAQIRQHLSQN